MYDNLLAGVPTDLCRANATIYGLVAFLYTRDLARSMRVTEQLESGMVGLNRGLV